MTNIIIKRINKHSRVVDIFTGQQGWEDWARYAIVRLKGQDYLKFLRGRPLNKAEFDYVTTKLGV